MNYQEKAFEEAVSCFGMERVSLTADSSAFYIIIHFPEFTIRNSAGKSHFITDLYVRLKMNLADGRLLDLAGTRTIVTPEENNSAYLQSHIHSSRALGVFDTFCTGDSIITTLKSELANKFNEDKFAGLIYSLEQMVSWESKEGTPYISIESISMRNQAPNTINVPDLEDIKKQFYKRASSLKFDYSFSDMNTKVLVEIPKEQIEEILSTMLIDKPQYFVEKVGTQYYRLGANTGGVTEERGFTTWQFNGKHLPMRVRSLNKTTSNAARVIHPHLTKLLHEQILKEFQEFIETKLH